jgi:hypothetical protein
LKTWDVTIFMVKSVAENVIAVEVWGLVMEESIFEAMWTLLSDFFSRGSGINKWGLQLRRSTKSYLWGENSRSNINWLCLVMALPKTLSCKHELSTRWNSKIYDRTTIAFVQRFLLSHHFWRIWIYAIVLAVVCAAATIFVVRKRATTNTFDLVSTYFSHPVYFCVNLAKNFIRVDFVMFSQERKRV